MPPTYGPYTSDNAVTAGGKSRVCVTPSIKKTHTDPGLSRWCLEFTMTLLHNFKAMTVDVKEPLHRAHRLVELQPHSEVL